VASFREQLLPYYAGFGFTARLYFRLKWRRGQLYDFTERFVPRRGRVLDVGCGYGLFTNVCAIGSRERDVVGLDLDERRIEVARQTVGQRPNVRFEVGRLEDLDGSGWDCLILFDVIHHLARATHAPLFGRARELLAPGGVLIVKDIDRRPRWKFLANLVVDVYNARLRGFTRGAALTYREPADVAAELGALGFAIERPALPGIGTCPHALLVCRAPGTERVSG
jgi:2-polyprenyl-6-hydroxyphenyl methylase/3-demethylubiquinone-9 3-methyltransferase